MPDEYIKRSDALLEIQFIPKGNWSTKRFLDAIEEVPAADVEPVRHGWWVERMLDNFKKYECACSECGARYIGNYDQYCEPAEFYYCPNCGAKMDEDG